VKNVRIANHWMSRNKINVIVVALVFGALGSIWVFESRASTPTASLEAESGTVSSAASTNTDTTASGGQAVKFGSAGSSSCALPVYPNATCTGVPAGTTLTAYTGPLTVTVANTVINGKSISGCIDIKAANVTIQNSKVTCTSGGTSTCSCAVSLDDGQGWNNWSVTVMDSEVDCGGDPPGGFNNSTAFGSAFMTIRRVNIHGCENGLDANQSIDVQDSYIHDLRQCTASQCGGDGSHTDGLQMASGHYSPAGSNNIAGGALNIKIIHNTILSMKAGAPTNGTASDVYFTTSAVISNPGATVDTSVTIDNNLLGGGAFTLYCARGAGTKYAGTSEVKFNHFTTRYRSSVGAYDPSSDCSNENIAGNVYDDTSADGAHNAGDPVQMN
jgi:hypothetical protein